MHLLDSQNDKVMSRNKQQITWKMQQVKNLNKYQCSEEEFTISKMCEKKITNRKCIMQYF